MLHNINNYTHDIVHDTCGCSAFSNMHDFYINIEFFYHSVTIVACYTLMHVVSASSGYLSPSLPTLSLSLLPLHLALSPLSVSVCILACICISKPIPPLPHPPSHLYGVMHVQSKSLVPSDSPAWILVTPYNSPHALCILLVMTTVQYSFTLNYDNMQAT